MRPVARGASPQAGPFTPYDSAKSPLLARIGRYCSYCERQLEVSLAIEHIQPKGLAAYAHLVSTWTNFLFACTNCNSTKGSQDVVLTDLLLPDRDNTCLAYRYTPDGKVSVAPALVGTLRAQAEELLRLTGLDRKVDEALDENDKQIVVDRVSKRIETFALARDAAARIVARPGDEYLMETTVELARFSGQFSIWMEAFAADAEMRRRLIDAHPGTRESGCFDAVTQAPVSPHPNTDGLAPGART